MFMNDKLLLTVPDVAYALSCSSYKVYTLINNGILGYKKYGRAFRIPREDVENYAKSDLRYKQREKPSKSK